MATPMRQGGEAPSILLELNEKVNEIVVSTMGGGPLADGVDLGNEGDLEETMDFSEVPAGDEEPGLSDGEEEEERVEAEEDDGISEEEEGVMGRPQRLNVLPPARYREDEAAPAAPREAPVPHAGRSGCSKCRFSMGGCAARGCRK